MTISKYVDFNFFHVNKHFLSLIRLDSTLVVETIQLSPDFVGFMLAISNFVTFAEFLHQ